jgi:glycosyltransferase involved in cell wall biosynthesis
MHMPPAVGVITRAPVVEDGAPWKLRLLKPDPAVSIVTIMYNAARFLEEAVDSVLAQSFADWELLLVNDGSEDDSERIARRYVHAHGDRIRLLEHRGGERRGTASSRNLGLAHARGRYVAELDADDAWGRDFLARRVAALETEPPAALAFGPVKRWYSWSSAGPRAVGDAEDWVARPWDALGARLIDAPRLLPILFEDAPRGGVPKGWLIRRAVMTELGGYPEQFTDMYEDQALLVKIGLAHASVYLGTVDYLYRRHPDSMVSVLNRTRDRRAMRAGFLSWAEAYFRGRQVDASVRRSLRRELRRCRHPRLSAMLDYSAQLPGRTMRVVRRRLAQPLSAVNPYASAERG